MVFMAKSKKERENTFKLLKIKLEFGLTINEKKTKYIIIREAGKDVTANLVIKYTYINYFESYK